MKQLFPFPLFIGICFYIILPLTPLMAQVTPLVVTTTTSDNGLAAHKYEWKDVNNQLRTAVMVDQRPAGAGYLRQFIYKVSGTDRVCRGTGANGHQGDGYVQNHTVYGGDNSSHVTAGTTTLPLQGRHHSIIDFYMPNYTIKSPNGSGGTNATVPTRVQWFFATGRDYPIYSMTQDARAITAGNIGADSRSPYGDFHYDGNTNSGAYSGDVIGGASWGDNYKWVSVVNGTTNESTQVTTGSGWRYNEPNTIPYAMQWTKNVNAEMGHVATLPMGIKDMGRNGSPLLSPGQNLNGPMIGDEQWCYQILAYGIINSTGGVTKRLTWGTNWGYPGGFDEWGSYSSKTDFSRHGNGSRTNGMLLGYSVWEVLGIHTGGYKNGSVGKMVQQMENMQLATLTASVGLVKTSGPAGVGLTSSLANNVPFSPEGYNPIFATWEANADNNIVDMTLNPTNTNPIENPVFVIHNFTAASVNSVCINNSGAVADVDYFASVDAANQKLWITVKRTASTPLRVAINTSACVTLLPIKWLSFSAQPQLKSVLLTWQTIHTNMNDQYLLERSENGIDFSAIHTDRLATNTVNSTTYRDDAPVAGTNFYRIKWMEANGNISYSKTVTAVFKQPIGTVVPTANKNQYLVTLHGLQQGTIKVVDMSGKVAYRQKIGLQEIINLTQLPAGMYYLQIQTTVANTTQKIVIR